MPQLVPHRAKRPYGRCLQTLELVALGVVALGCSVASEDYASDADGGSTHAVVAIARDDSIGGASRADAFAGFLHLPAGTDRQAALDAAGLGLDLPALDSCVVGEHRRRPTELSSLSRIELLDAGRVRLLAESAEAPHELAPHAFPTVTDLISGVVYASRDQSADGLPAGSLYRVEAGDGGTFAPLSVEHSAPPALMDVTAAGMPLEAVDSVAVDAPLDLTWSVSGDTKDFVYVELTESGSSTSSSVVCAFEDAAGAGTVPTEHLTAGEVGHLLVHRVRRARPDVDAPALGGGEVSVDQLELRFDFSLSTRVELK